MGSMPRRPLADRLWEKVEIGAPDECWRWTGAAANGYGRIQSGDGRVVQASRVAYELVRGPIADGLVIDHLCEMTLCVNPAHLEAVTQQDNILRKAGQRTHCPEGHPLDQVERVRARDGRPPRTVRRCKTCRNARQKEYDRRKAGDKRGGG